MTVSLSNTLPQYHHLIKICKLDNCDRMQDTRGYCQKHYLEWKKYADKDELTFKPKITRYKNPRPIIDPNTPCRLCNNKIGELGRKKMGICQRCFKLWYIPRNKRQWNYYKDYTEQTINGFKFIERTKRKKRGNYIWKVECHCGKEYETIAPPIMFGSIKSCGCLTNKKGKESISFKDYSHQIINGILFLEEVGTRSKRRVWKLQCPCGKIFYSDIGAIKDRKTSKCHCRKNTQFTLPTDLSTSYQYNIQQKIRQNLSGRIRNALKLDYTTKSLKTMQLLGCSIKELKKHLEKSFKDGMTWENYGKYGWHIDHIKPCCSFDLANIEEQKECFHYTNLQPLWAIDNIKKGGKWESVESKDVQINENTKDWGFANCITIGEEGLEF